MLSEWLGVISKRRRRRIEVAMLRVPPGTGEHRIRRKRHQADRVFKHNILNNCNTSRMANIARWEWR